MNDDEKEANLPMAVIGLELNPFDIVTAHHFTYLLTTTMFKTAATRIAHNSTIPSIGGNKDLRPLQDLITAEKSVLISFVIP